MGCAATSRHVPNDWFSDRLSLIETRVFDQDVFPNLVEQLDGLALQREGNVHESGHLLTVVVPVAPVMGPCGAVP